MALATLTRPQLDEALHALGVQVGDGLLVHSAVQFLGKPEGGLALYLDSLQALVGPHGTLVVPAFSFEFAKTGQYDPASTPSQGMGVFSEFVRQQPGARRTLHPMQSVAALGATAEALAACDTPSAFDDGSAFERMLQADFKLLLLGADIQAASMVHYSEQRAAVPYRYWKDFAGQVKVGSQWQPRSYRMFVRDMDTDPQLRLAPIQAALQASANWRSLPLNHGQLALCRLQDFVTATDALLSLDPWALVGNRPEASRREAAH
ncbi:MAG: AAC(3) family N-acetyltransferase [Anaerolineales bacterium]|nr:MAG: AAC(3) family N-acetyltransferase [Anaerolineales bacterium]